MRHLLRLQVLLAACAAPPRPAPVPEPVPELPTSDLDTGEPVAPPRETAVESDPPASVDTELPDTLPSDTLFDTFVYVDTAGDTAQPAPRSRPSSPYLIHRRIHAPGQLLEVGPLVVTATRNRASPVATNGFTAQEPGDPVLEGGLYVDLKDEGPPPDPGDLVMIVGSYEEWPIHSQAPFASMSRLVVHRSIVGSSLIVVGRDDVPEPYPVSLEDLDKPAYADQCESLLIVVSASERMNVLDLPIARYGEFPVGVEGLSEVRLDPWYFDIVAALPARPGASVDTVAGLLLWEPPGPKLAPRGLDDFVGWASP